MFYLIIVFLSCDDYDKQAKHHTLVVETENAFSCVVVIAPLLCFRTDDVKKAYDYCMDYFECRYDYAMTLNRDLAHFTHNYKSSIINLKEVNRRRIVSCGVLETPRFGRKSNFLFVPNTKVTFECDQDFLLVGDQRRECMANGRWDVPEYGYTECLRKLMC